MNAKMIEAMQTGIGCALEFGPKGQQKGVISGALEMAFAMHDADKSFDHEAFLLGCGIRVIWSKGCFRGEMA